MAEGGGSSTESVMNRVIFGWRWHQVRRGWVPTIYGDDVLGTVDIAAWGAAGNNVWRLMLRKRCDSDKLLSPTA